MKPWPWLILGGVFLLMTGSLSALAPQISLSYLKTIELTAGREAEVSLPLTGLDDSATVTLRSPQGKVSVLVGREGVPGRWKVLALDETGLYDLVVTQSGVRRFEAPGVVRVVYGPLVGLTTEVQPGGTVLIRRASGALSPELRVWLRSGSPVVLKTEKTPDGLKVLVPAGLEPGSYGLTISSEADPVGVAAGTLVVSAPPQTALAPLANPGAPPVPEPTGLRDIRALYLASWPAQEDRFRELAAGLSPEERTGLSQVWHKEAWGPMFANLVTPLLPLGSIYLGDTSGAWWSGGLQVGGLAGFTALVAVNSGNNDPGPMFGLGVLVTAGGFLAGKVLGVVSPFLYADEANRRLNAALGAAPLP